MKDQHIKLVRESFAKVLPIKEAAAGLFYGRLFEIAPEVRPLFRGEMDEQGVKLMKMLEVIVNSLDDLDQLLPAAKAMAIRHVGYGVEASHYPIVGEALIWTLKQGLGDDFTPEDEEAWAAVYLLLASHMIEAAKAA